ncbi:MAG: hypothetical protein Fur0032_03280 [Terrimicrobiaceae bacterium]
MVGLVATAQFLHAVVHLQVAVSSVDFVYCEVHGHCDDHGSAADGTGDSPSNHHPVCDHSHSPAVLETVIELKPCGVATAGAVGNSFIPESPSAEIEYPPQLS